MFTETYDVISELRRRIKSDGDRIEDRIYSNSMAGIMWFNTIYSHNTRRPASNSLVTP